MPSQVQFPLAFAHTPIPLTSAPSTSFLSQSCRPAKFAKRIRSRPIPHRPVHPPTLPSYTTPSATLLSATLSSLTTFASTSAGVLLLGAVIFVHETGHYLAARLQKIRVKNFSIGFGPCLWKYTPPNSETEFTLRLFPLGGYVAFPEHTTTNEKTGEVTVDKDPDLLQNRPLLDRAIVISAGVIANIALAWACLFTSVQAVGLPTYSFTPGVTIANIVDNSGAAAKAGIRAGDIILSINGQKVAESLDSASAVAERIRTSRGAALDFGIKRDSSQFNVRVRPQCCSADGSAAMGVQLVPNAIVTRVRAPTVLKAVGATNAEFARLSKQTWNGLVAIASNFQQTSKNLAGPIGVVSMGADLARNDAAALLTFCAVISINLALINSLPLPALDGGQMAFLLVEAVKGSPISLRVQETINRTALLLFLAFSGVLVLGDLEKLSILRDIQRLFG